VHGLTRWLRHGADGVAAGMLAAMFATFLIQVAARYIFKVPVGWTVEVCLTLWLWTIFWTAAFCLRDNDHVKFDLVYLSVSMPVRRVFAAISAVAIITALIVALPATWDYVDFYKIRRSATLRIPLKYIFMIYIIFVVVMVLRYAWGLFSILRGKELEDREPI